MQKIVNRNSLLYVIFILLSLIMTSSICYAQNFKRKGRTEIFGLIQQMSGDTTTGLGMNMEVDSFTGFGFGSGYNFNENFNINFDIFFSSTDINAGVYDISVTGDSSIWGLDFNLDYNILKTKITPIVTAGIGFINFSGDFQGFDFNETDFSYNLGIGSRFDITEHFLIKGLYRATWTKLEDTDKKIMLDGISLSLGYNF